MSVAPALRDWTRGEPGIVYQACPACRHAWYFQRTFCPRCGNEQPQARQAAGSGVVHAITVVMRAPSEEYRALAPYAICLVDTDEGFRMMAHADRDLAIGQRVRVRFVSVAGHLLPHFGKAD